MQRNTVIGIVLGLLLVAGEAQADSRDHRGGRDGHGGKAHGDYRHDRHDRGRHYRGGHGHSQRYYRGRGYYRGWARPWYPAPRYRPRYYYPGYLGSALVGAAVSYSFYHSHNGASCHDQHLGSGGTRYEVVGCHRIEYLPDGSQRRIEVPLSACQ